MYIFFFKDIFYIFDKIILIGIQVNCGANFFQ